MSSTQKSKFFNSFSIPFNYNLKEYEIFESFLKDYKKYIFDIYIGCNIDPFKQDAMGLSNNDLNKNFLFIINLGEKYNIPISLTFNNICISSSYENYKKFIINLQKLLKSFKHKKVKWHFTIPFTLWLKFGFRQEIEKFLNQKILIKNTILWNLNDPAKIAKQFEEGFDYINLDRNLVRNTDLLKEIQKMKKILEKKLNKNLYISILANESCEGNCSIQNDHFIYNLNKKDKNFFEDDINRLKSCFYKDQINPRLYLLKTANIIPEQEEYSYYKEYIDVFKMHGRENLFVFFQTLQIIQNIITNNNNLAQKYQEIFSNDDYNEYKKIIKNCKFRCYNCNYCDEKVKLFEKNKSKKLKEIKLF